MNGYADCSQLKPFLDQYVAGRTDVKASTRTNLGIGRNRLLAFFAPDRGIHTITAGDADEFLLYLRGQYAGATAAKTMKWARQFFKAAVRKKLISSNPFEGIKIPGMTNKDRQVFISRADAQLVLDAAPDAEWRLIIALARYGGIRTPSETFAIQWSDVNWARNRFLVRSEKTKHIEDKESRLVPIFPELKPYLEEAFDQAEEGAVYVISRHRLPSANLRTGFCRIIRKAGLIPWTKPFHNLRSTRETELAQEFPLHVVAGWIGNSVNVAMQSYLQMTEEFFERAAQGDGKSGAKSGADVVQNPVQHCKAPSRTISQESTETVDNCEVVRNDAEPYLTMHSSSMTPTGFEPVSQP